MPTVLVIGCGKPQHQRQCLCDVIVSQPTPINDDLRDGWLVRELIECLDLVGALSPQDLVTFLTAWVRLHDAHVEQRRTSAINNSTWRPRHPEATELATQMFLDGASTREVRTEVKSRFGVDLSKSHASHLRRRVLERACAR